MPHLSEKEKAEITEFLFYHVADMRPPPGTPSFSATVLGKGTFGVTYKVGDHVVKLISLQTEYDEKTFTEEVKGWEKLSKIKKLEKYLPKYEGHSFYKYVPQKDYMNSIKNLQGAALFTQPGVKVIGCIFQEHEPVDPLDQVIVNMKILKGVESESKAKITRTAKLLANETTAALFLDNLIRAYTYLHEAGFVHRDIKPGNILVRTTEDKVHLPMVIDIGMLCEMPCIDTALKGTYPYMTPNYLNTLNRPRPRFFNVNRGSANALSTKIRNGLQKMIGMRVEKPIRPTQKNVILKKYQPYKPFYNKHTDNYALAITMQAFIKNVKWDTKMLKEHYEFIALRYIHSMAAFLTAGKKAFKNLTRNRKNVNALARLVFINEHEGEAENAAAEGYPPLPESNSENND